MAVCCVEKSDKSDGDESSDDSDCDDHEQRSWLAELNWRRMHPERLHEELWFNLPQEVPAASVSPQISAKMFSVMSCHFNYLQPSPLKFIQKA